MVAVTAALFRCEGRYRRITFSTALLVTAGFAGCALAIASQSGHLVATWELTVVYGAALAVSSALATALAVYLFRWGADLVRDLPGWASIRYGAYALELFGLAVAIVITDVFSIALNSVIGLAAGEQLEPLHLVIGLVGGMVIYTVGSVTWRLANLLTDNLGINAFGYATPALALVWLLVCSQVAVASLELLIIGAATILTANLLINFGDRLPAFRA